MVSLMMADIDRAPDSSRERDNILFASSVTNRKKGNGLKTHPCFRLVNKAKSLTVPW